jgi:hypothetical protein
MPTLEIEELVLRLALICGNALGFWFLVSGFWLFFNF